MDFNKECKERIKKIAKNNNLKFVILYGSIVKNIKNINSDIDLAVLGNRDIAFEDIIDMNNEFSEIFCEREADIKSLHNVDPLFRYQVTSNGILLFGTQHE
ncbi:MAG: type VII toxin-antitoxin system MntA family adenylyltransferase antitoxin, partial [Candidatus Anammoxibacter sp.]